MVGPSKQFFQIRNRVDKLNELLQKTKQTQNDLSNNFEDNFQKQDELLNDMHEQLSVINSISQAVGRRQWKSTTEIDNVTVVGNIKIDSIYPIEEDITNVNYDIIDDCGESLPEEYNTEIEQTNEYLRVKIDNLAPGEHSYTGYVRIKLGQVDYGEIKEFISKIGYDGNIDTCKIMFNEDGTDFNMPADSFSPSYKGTTINYDASYTDDLILELACNRDDDFVEFFIYDLTMVYNGYLLSNTPVGDEDELANGNFKIPECGISEIEIEINNLEKTETDIFEWDYFNIDVIENEGVNVLVGIGENGENKEFSDNKQFVMSDYFSAVDVETVTVNLLYQFDVVGTHQLVERGALSWLA